MKGLVLILLFTSCSLHADGKNGSDDKQSNEEDKNKQNETYNEDNERCNNFRENEITEDMKTTCLKLSMCNANIESSELEAYHIEKIKANILEKLGYNEAPNFKIPPLSDAPVFKQITEENVMYRSGHEDDIENVNDQAVKEMFLFRSVVPERLSFLPDELKPNILYFDFTPEMMVNTVLKAKLWVYIRPSEKETNLILNISTISPDINNKHTLNITYCITKQLDSDIDNQNQRGYWSEYDIIDVVSHWFHDPEDYYGILVQALTTDGKQLVVTEPQDGEEANRPFIEMSLNEGDGNRKKRSPRTSLICSNERNGLCCRHPFVVDFASVNWNWIIEPKRYITYYCTGSCFRHYPKMTWLNYLLELNNVGKNLQHCCAPSKYSDISILYYLESGLIEKINLSKMIADECYCT